MNKKHKYIYHILIMLFCLYFVYKSKGDDIAFHTQRISAIAYEFKNNGFSNFPVRIYHSTLGGYGYSSPLFYGDVFLYIPAMLVAFCHLNVTVVFQGLILCIIIGTIISAYFSLVWIGINKKISLLISGFYGFSPYILTDHFNRAAIGESLAAVFLPLAIVSFYMILSEKNKQKKKYIFVLAFSMVGLLLSHLITTLITTVGFVCWLILKYVYCIVKKTISFKPILYLFVSACIAIGISAFFLFPLIEQMLHSNGLNAFNGSGIDPSGSTITLKSMFITWNGEALLINILNKIAGTELKTSSFYTVGAFIYPILSIIIVTILNYRKFNKKNKKVIISCILISVVLILSMSIKIIWKNDFLAVIQFPWRLLLIYTIVICLTASILLNLKELATKYKALICLGFIIATLVYAIPMLVAAKSVESLNTQDLYNSYSIGLDDYLVNGYKSSDIEDRGEIIKSTNAQGIYDYYKTSDSLYLTYENSVGEELELPLTYVYGYSAIDLNSGQDYRLTSSEMGLLQVELPVSRSGDIIIKYSGTNVQKISNWVTIISIISIIVYFAVLVCFNKRRKQCKVVN